MLHYSSLSETLFHLNFLPVMNITQYPPTSCRAEFLNVNMILLIFQNLDVERVILLICLIFFQKHLILSQSPKCLCVSCTRFIIETEHLFCLIFHPLLPHHLYHTSFFSEPKQALSYSHIYQLYEKLTLYSYLSVL